MKRPTLQEILQQLFLSVGWLNNREILVVQDGRLIPYETRSGGAGGSVGKL